LPRTDADGAPKKNAPRTSKSKAYKKQTKPRKKRTWTAEQSRAYKEKLQRTWARKKKTAPAKKSAEQLAAPAKALVDMIEAARAK